MSTPARIKKKPFADELKALRAAADLTQEESATVLDVSKSVIEKWERGDRTPLLITQEGALARLQKQIKTK